MQDLPIISMSSPELVLAPAGGLVTTMITAPNKDKRPMHAAKDIVTSFYLEQSPKIFPQQLYIVVSLFYNYYWSGLFSITMSSI